LEDSGGGGEKGVLLLLALVLHSRARAERRRAVSSRAWMRQAAMAGGT
jgi:hypothetical protein